MGKAPLISVIIPVYNTGRYLRQCIDSVISQTYRNIEIILVDDGSSDDSATACDYYQHLDNRVVTIHKKNAGSSSSREIGVKYINGEYVMFVDDDDWLDIDTVDQCVEAIKKNPSIGCVMFSYNKETEVDTVIMNIMDESAVFVGNEAKDRIHRRIFGLIEDELNHPERMENVVSCCMKLYRVDYARQGRYFDINEIGTCEDGLFNVYALENCNTIAYIDKPLYHYRKHSGSLVNTYKPEMIQQWNRLFSIMEEYISDRNPSARYDEALNNRIALSITAIALNKFGDEESTAVEVIRYIHKYICSERYHEAVSKIKIAELPLAWKILLICCKFKNSPAVYSGMLIVRNLLKHGK